MESKICINWRVRSEKHFFRVSINLLYNKQSTNEYYLANEQKQAGVHYQRSTNLSLCYQMYVDVHLP